MQHRRVLSVNLVLVAIALHADQRCRLRQMRIEHLRNFMSCIPKTDGRRDKPSH
jgi:hypothetical protein